MLRCMHFVQHKQTDFSVVIKIRGKLAPGGGRFIAPGIQGRLRSPRSFSRRGVQLERRETARLPNCWKSNSFYHDCEDVFSRDHVHPPIMYGCVTFRQSPTARRNGANMLYLVVG